MGKVLAVAIYFVVVGLVIAWEQGILSTYMSLITQIILGGLAGFKLHDSVLWLWNWEKK